MTDYGSDNFNFVKKQNEFVISFDVTIYDWTAQLRSPAKFEIVFASSYVAFLVLFDIKGKQSRHVKTFDGFGAGWKGLLGSRRNHKTIMMNIVAMFAKEFRVFS